MKVYETGKTHHVVKIQDTDGTWGYAVRHNDHNDVNEYKTPALFDAIKACKMYESFLEQAHEYVPEPQWGKTKQQPNFDAISKAN